MRSNGRVLYPLSDLTVLPCMGSDCHTTILPDASTAEMSLGRCSLNSSAPMRTMIMILPGWLLGLITSISSINSAGSHLSLVFENTPLNKISAFSGLCEAQLTENNKREEAREGDGSWDHH